jgi:MoxR-like ATPase
MQGKDLLQGIRDNVARIIVGKEESVELLLTALVCRGHVLIEDVPGIGKTTLAQAFARSLALDFHRIQFTPDILPSDITGFTLYDLPSGRMEHHPGAVMSQVVLADEINRCGPKTQSSLLEVMEENQVTVDGTTYPVPQPFLVLATQNPIEYAGTFPLPESQLDRFLFRVKMGYPDRQEEVRILERHAGMRTKVELTPVASAEEVLRMQEECLDVHVSAHILDYIARIAALTRSSESFSLGLSPRGGIALMRAARARAYLRGRTFVLPDDVQALVVPTVLHRLVLRPEAALTAGNAVRLLTDLLRAVPVPAVR